MQCLEAVSMCFGMIQHAFTYVLVGVTCVFCVCLKWVLARTTG